MSEYKRETDLLQWYIITPTSALLDALSGPEVFLGTAVDPGACDRYCNVGRDWLADLEANLTSLVRQKGDMLSRGSSQRTGAGFRPGKLGRCFSTRIA